MAARQRNYAMCQRRTSKARLARNRPLTEAAYFSADEIVEKVVLRWVPSPVITGMMATAIPAAMRPYSIAVAADSSFRKARSFCSMSRF